MTPEYERHLQEMKHIARFKRLYFHVMAFLVVGGDLVLIDLVTGGAVRCFWPLGIWALILVAHALRFFLRERRRTGEAQSITVYLDAPGPLSYTTLDRECHDASMTPRTCVRQCSGNLLLTYIYPLR